MPSLVFFFYCLARIAYYLINLNIIIRFNFNIIGPNGIIFKRFGFNDDVSLSLPCPGNFGCSFLLETFILSYFFQFRILFIYFCLSVLFFICCYWFYGHLQYFFLCIFNVSIALFIPLSNPQRWRFLFLPFFYTYIYIIFAVEGLVHSHQFPCPLVFLSEFLRWKLKKMPRVHYKRNYKEVYSFDEISASKFAFEKFCCSSGKHFSFIFLSSLHFQWCQLPIFQSCCNFPSVTRAQMPHWFRSSILFIDPLLPILIFILKYFFSYKFRSMFLAVYSNFLHRGLLLFHNLFTNIFISSMYIIIIIIIICYFVVSCIYICYFVYYYYHHAPLRVFHTNVSWWSSNGVWVKGDLLKSQYSGRSQWFCSLDCLDSFSYFQVLQFLYQSLGDCTKNSFYTCITPAIFMSHSCCFFQLSWKA